MNPPNRSSNAPLSGFGVDHADSEPMSKLNGLGAAVPLELDSAGRGAGGDNPCCESKAETKDVNMGLLAMVVYDLGGTPELSPNPKSICITPSVAVCWGVSSSRLSIPGSNVVSELKSSGFDEFVCGDEAGNDAEGDRTYIEPDADTPGTPPDFGTENVKLDSLSITFSFCSRDSRSRRFSFSEVAASFLASRAATLSSSFRWP
jgi:hypothetical protein